MKLIEWSACQPYRLKINTVVTAANKNDIPDMVDTLALHARTVKRWSLDQFIPVNRGKLNERRYSISDGEYSEVVREVKARAAGRFDEGVFGGSLKKAKEGTVMMFGPQGVPYVTAGDEKKYLFTSIRAKPLYKLVQEAQQLHLDLIAMNERRYAADYYLQ